MHLADNAQLQTAEAAFFLIPFAADAASTAGHLTEKKMKTIISIMNP